MSNEMIEKVARALCRAYGFDDSAVIYSYQTRQEALENDPPRVPISVKWKEYEPFAKAAIKAMREPTKAMCLAGNKGSQSRMESMANAGGVPPYMLEWAWPAMIDAVLDESLIVSQVTGDYKDG